MEDKMEMKNFTHKQWLVNHDIDVYEFDKPPTNEEKDKLREKWRANYQSKKKHLQWLKDKGTNVNTEEMKAENRERAKIFRDRHKDDEKEYCNCDCKWVYLCTSKGKYEHMRSKRHMKYLESLKQIDEIKIERYSSFILVIISSIASVTILFF